jgi:hypothetical protein
MIYKEAPADLSLNSGPKSRTPGDTGGSGKYDGTNIKGS